MTAIILLLALAAYFAVAETAFAAASRTRIRTAADRGEKNAVKAQFVLDNFNKAISTILIGTNIVHMSAAAIVTVMVTRIWGLSAVTLSTVITTIAVFFFGEMLPKTIGKKYPERFAKSCAPLLIFFMKLFAPVALILSKIGEAAASLSREDDEISVTEDELYDIIEDMTEEGSLDEEQGELISSALQFGDVEVESILTPRVDVAAIDAAWTPEQILKVIQENNHSRFPVYEGSVDNIIGILQIRRFLKHYLRYGDRIKVKDLLDEVLFVHQSMKIDDLLPILSRRQMNLAVVTDNYGGTLGIVTVENILEELVGEIWDEDDVAVEPVKDIREGACIVRADESVSDVFDHLGYEDPEDDEELVNTLMGEWAYEHFTKIPEAGDSFIYHGIKVTVLEVFHNRIMRLKAELEPESPEIPEGGEG
ncbi:MAG: hemolysin family protein [Lachnospiraceae bacterium]|nr:hemolysin family protein [Lachnospiraceae bacterium]